MDGEVEEGRMNEKRLILNLAREACMIKAVKTINTIDSISDKLSKLDDQNSSVKVRAAKRTALSIKCEERDRWLNRIEIIDHWLKEIE